METKQGVKAELMTLTKKNIKKKQLMGEYLHSKCVINLQSFKIKKIDYQKTNISFMAHFMNRCKNMLIMKTII